MTLNRRSLFKRAGLLAAGAAAAPLVGAEPQVDAGEVGGANLVVDGKVIGSVHSIEFSHPLRVADRVVGSLLDDYKMSGIPGRYEAEIEEYSLPGDVWMRARHTGYVTFTPADGGPVVRFFNGRRIDV